MSASLVASSNHILRPIFPKYIPSPSFQRDYRLMANSLPNDSDTSTTISAPTKSGLGSPTDAFAKPSNPSKRTSGRRDSPNESSSRTKRLRPSPAPLTAAAALEDRSNSDKAEKSSTAISPNPATEALNALMGVKLGSMTSPPKTPSEQATTMSEPLTVVASNIQERPTDVNTDGPAQTSPVSLSSIGTLEGNIALSGLDNTTVDSPRSIDDVSHDAEAAHDATTPNNLTVPDDGPKSFSYPVPALQAALQSNRGMSLPGSESRSGSNKRHRCPYCETEFTRHHNLKSHLLTHSHEKPYVCQTCNSRFRRLHDLKRHTKLHTGERPHICPKCGRKFARVDALARHNKGPGGCAGRRDSTGSFGDGGYDAGNGDAMEGLVYGEPENMDEDESPSAQRTVPDIRRQATGMSVRGQTSDLNRQPSTYPPIQGRPPGGIASGLYPHSGPGRTTSSSSKLSPGPAPSYPPASAGSSNLHPSGPASGSVFPPGSITESPRPLTPGGPPGSHAETGLYRNRSPSNTSQFQQQLLKAARRSPPPLIAASLPGSSQLPPPAGLNPPEPRYTLPSQGPAHPPTGPTGPPTHMSGGGLSSQSNSLSSHGQSARGSGENSTAMLGPREDRLWAYVRSLEDRINGLQGEVTSLKEQLAATNQPN